MPLSANFSKMNSEIKITNYQSFKKAQDELQQELLYHEDAFNEKVEEIKQKFSFVNKIVNLFKHPAAGGLSGNFIYLALSNIVGMALNKLLKNNEAASGLKDRITGFFKQYAMRYKDVITNLAFNTVFNKVRKRKQKQKMQEQEL